MGNVVLMIAAGVIYGQAAAGVVMGALAALWGWRYVAGLNELDKPALQVPRLIQIQTVTGADNAYIHRADDPNW